MATVTKSRYMPPWHAEPGFGDFADERRLTDAQIETIARWVEQRMPRGESARMPRLPSFTEGWQLGTAGSRARDARGVRRPGERPGHLPQLRHPNGTDRRQVRARGGVSAGRAAGRASRLVPVCQGWRGGGADPHRWKAGLFRRDARSHGAGLRPGRRSGRLGGGHDAALPAREPLVDDEQGIRLHPAAAPASDGKTGKGAVDDRRLLCGRAAAAQGPRDQRAGPVWRAREHRHSRR